MIGSELGLNPPDKDYVIISGRLYQDLEAIKQEHGADRTYYLREFGAPGDKEMSGLHKAQLINYLGVRKYYEHDLQEAAIIRKHCKRCRVVIVKTQ